MSLFMQQLTVGVIILSVVLVVTSIVQALREMFTSYNPRLGSVGAMLGGMGFIFLFLFGVAFVIIFTWFIGVIALTVIEVFL